MSQRDYGSGVTLTLPPGSLTAIAGPDGSGKTTLIRLAAGLLVPDAGTLRVLGLDVKAQPQRVQDRLGYMPQRFGLYEDLSVQENLDLYADLHGVPAAERGARYAQLLAMTQLGPFTARLAGRLSGGMKQKLGLACTLVRRPELLLLDEPTVGVDPLSRRELWQIVGSLVRDEHLTVLLATTSLDEAQACDQVVLLREGRVLAAGTPRELGAAAASRSFMVAPAPGEPPRRLQSRLLDDPAIVDAVPHAGQVRFVQAAAGPPHAGLERARSVPPTLEDGFMIRLREAAAEARRVPAPGGVDGAVAAPTGPALSSSRIPATVSDKRAPSEAPAPSSDIVIEVRDLLRTFGDFTAVRRTSFSVRRGEVFGLLGPNGAGKTTTFRMLCGLLPPSGGTLRVAGLDMRRAPGAARRRIGYVSQRFALYGNLSCAENLEFFAHAYGLAGSAARERVRAMAQAFDLVPALDTAAARLPGGFRQRLAMAAALLHQPGILFLDEPTSGADPLARREFWRRITALAAEGTTIVVTTHFMEEAEYCDRIVIQDAGRVLALGTPDEVREGAGGAADMEQAFIGIVERARAAGTHEAAA